MLVFLIQEVMDIRRNGVIAFSVEPLSESFDERFFAVNVEAEEINSLIKAEPFLFGQTEAVVQRRAVQRNQLRACVPLLDVDGLRPFEVRVRVDVVAYRRVAEFCHSRFKSIHVLGLLQDDALPVESVAGHEQKQPLPGLYSSLFDQCREVDDVVAADQMPDCG